MTKQTTFTQMFPGKSPAEIDAAKLRETLEEEYQAYQEAQDDEYEERVRASYRARGYHNIY